MCRTSWNYGKALTFWEETDKGTREASRGSGPSTHARIAEITSGRAISQQGLAVRRGGGKRPTV